MSAFWWDSFEHKRKTHWVSWEKLCLAKDQGGLGFKDIQSFNQALLAKQAWRLLQNPNCLFARFFKSRYFDGEDFLEAEIGARPSYAWRSIIHGRELLLKGLRKEVGNGNSLRAWAVGQADHGPRTPLMKHFSVNLSLKVKDLIDFDSRRWNRELLDDLFYPVDVEIIIKKNPVVNMEDFWVWLHSKSGEYSVKTGYWLAFRDNKSDLIRNATSQPSLNGLKEKVWSILAAPKIKLFLWRALCAALPLWAISGVPTPEFGFGRSAIFANMQFLFELQKNFLVPAQIRRLWPWVLWRLWKNRNKLCYEGTQFCPAKSFENIKEDAHEWSIAQSQINSTETHSIGHNASGSVPCDVPVSSPWQPPPPGWVKCNIGAAWSGKKCLAGSAWVLRNEHGVVLLHSRRALCDVTNRSEAILKSVIWAIECLHSHKMSRVLFAFEPGDLLSAFNRPNAWPSFRYQVSELLHFLGKIVVWNVLEEKIPANRGASLIAQSVVKEDRVQSYVASGHPRWLHHLFEEERIGSVVSSSTLP
ncbi:Ribonuclease H domain [Arabidopsis suecica]|uniref:Ribonuclease H domain n=1 Tax=Arabidopsis suecica TaxID=45249 RepID=A0A8T2AFF1_ARASU|nr:Ribonuclease H domain [Arabidopsis suecica]